MQRLTMQKQRTVSVLFCLLFLSATSVAQRYWMQQGGGVTIDEAADISIDSAGNIYATGYFTSLANFGVTPYPVFSLSSYGTTDIYLAKLDTSGLYQWVIKAGGAGSDRPFAIKTDAAGNSYITGFFYDTATFGSQVISSSGLQDVFVAK